MCTGVQSLGTAVQAAAVFHISVIQIAQFIRSDCSGCPVLQQTWEPISDDLDMLCPMICHRLCAPFWEVVMHVSGPVRTGRFGVKQRTGLHGPSRRFALIKTEEPRLNL